MNELKYQLYQLNYAYHQKKQKLISSLLRLHYWPNHVLFMEDKYWCWILFFIFCQK